jgi:hypothetical protein
MDTQSVQPQSELSKFAHKVLLAHAGILVLLLALIGAGGYFGLKSYDRALQHAEALQAQFNQAQAQASASQKALSDLLAQDAQERAQESAQQASLTQQILQRDAARPSPAVQTALQPSANAVDLKMGLEDAFKGVQGFGVVQVGSGVSVVLNQAQTAAVITSRETEIQKTADLADTSQLYALEKSKTTSLANDLSSCQSTVSKDSVALLDAQKALKAYDKLARRSKFRKLLGSVGRNAERVGILVLGYEIGRKL